VAHPEILKRAARLGEKYKLAEGSLSEFRKDPLTGQTVIVAPQRSRRPNAFAQERDGGADDEVCPFCEGHEDETPPEVFALRKEGTEADTPGWFVRVVPNKFPALIPAAQSMETPILRADQPLKRGDPAIGVHEAIIESPRHVTSLALLSESEIARILAVYRHRLLDLRRDNSIRYALIFKNEGRLAGASIPHVHSQLMALQRIPRLARRALRRASRHYEREGRCLACDLIRNESAAGDRLIHESSGFVVVANDAGRFPYESRILPKAHQAEFELAAPEQLLDLAATLRRLLRALDSVVKGAAYNLTLHSAPPGVSCQAWHHWYLELIPRLTRIAGFEFASGWHVNTVAPEQAAEQLRKVVREAS
jgi:UDPglucose--hexose-1-phosphate uridylyltransferase